MDNVDFYPIFANPAGAVYLPNRTIDASPIYAQIIGSFYDHPAEKLNKVALGGIKAEQKSKPITKEELIKIKMK